MAVTSARRISALGLIGGGQEDQVGHDLVAGRGLVLAGFVIVVLIEKRRTTRARQRIP